MLIKDMKSSLTRLKLFISITGILLVMAIFNTSKAGQDFYEQRQNMVAEIEADVTATSTYTGISKLSPDVLKAISSVKRHEFVPDHYKSVAYLNQPLPIGHGQTISQPYIVALMTQLAEVNSDAIILEVGTGSGYQAAVIAEIVKHVYTIEIVEALAKRARKDLQRLGYKNITVKAGDGYHGWPEHAPFDAILVTAAPEAVPEPLLEQLKRGGKLVIPVGKQGATQSLMVYEKDTEDKIKKSAVLPVGFVPLTRN